MYDYALRQEYLLHEHIMINMLDLSLIQKDILVTLISLYEKKSIPIKGEEIAAIIRRNPGTVRNQMQSLKAIGLVDGTPGPKGGYHPTVQAYREYNIDKGGDNYDVCISRGNEQVAGVKVSEIAFTTLTHAELCHAMVSIVGSIRTFEIGDIITIGPTPVNKLLIIGEVFGKDEVEPALMISIIEMVSLPKEPIKRYMSHPIKMLKTDNTLFDAITLFTKAHIHGAPVMEGLLLCGIVTMSDILTAIANGTHTDASVREIMTEEVIQTDSSVQLWEVIRMFKEKEIGRLIVIEDEKPVGILTRSDVFRVLPSV